jgi:endonuclease YncB( thermonuclease family)
MAYEENSGNPDPRRIGSSNTSRSGYDAESFKSTMGGSYTNSAGEDVDAEIDAVESKDTGKYDHIEYADIGSGDGTPEEEEDHISQDDVLAYVKQINLWTSSTDVYDEDGNFVRSKPTAEDADLVEEIQAERQRLAEKILEDDGLRLSGLSKVKSYLKADLEELRRAEAHSSDFVEYHREDARLYDKQWGDENPGDPFVYAAKSRAIADQVSSGEEIDDQYGLLRVRREGALQNFDDPAFVAGVALYDGGSYKDEMMVDFDRKDLTEDKTNQGRSKALAEIFSERVANHPGDKETLSAKAKSFQNLRMMGHTMRSEHDAVAKFAEGFKDNDPHRKLGLAAMQNVTYSAPVFNQWFHSFENKEDARNLERSDIAIFDAACKRFQSEFDSNDPKAALSFAVMENFGRRINKSLSLSREASNSPDLGESEAVLNLFDKRWEKKHVDTIPEKFEADVLKRMGEQGAKLPGSKDGFATIKGKGKEDDWELDLATAKSIEIEDGGHMKVTTEEGKSTIIKLAGMDVPKVGVETRSKAYDAGMAARENLAMLVNRHGIESLSMKMVRNDKGETRLEARLPSGEDISNRMILDGFAVPNREVPGHVRREGLSHQSESRLRGLWAEGFVDMSDDWRSEKSGPGLTKKDKAERLGVTVGESMATSASHAKRLLLRPSTKIFALPVENWSSAPIIDQQIEEIARKNPGRLKGIYAENMEILTDLRKRKANLTEDEKLAHDRLSLGRRAIAKALVPQHMTEEQARKDGHPLMSKKAKTIDPKYLRTLGNAAADVGALGYDLAEGTLKTGKNAMSRIIDLAME